MKTITHYLSVLTGFLIFSSMFWSCKDNELFKDQKRTYISMADSTRSMPGNNRVKLVIKIPSQEIVSASVFWNNRKDRQDVSLKLTAWPDTVSTIIGPLAEGSYTFEVITYDKQGNASIPVKTEGTVLGSNYVNALLNRPVKDIYYENGDAIVYWGNAEREALTEVSYTDNNGVLRKVRAAFGKDTTKLVNIKPGNLSTTIAYKTAYVPNLAIDTFYANSKTETVITGSLKELAKDKNIFFGSLISYGGPGTNGVINDGSANGAYTAFCNREFNLGQGSWGPSRWARGGPSNFDAVNPVTNWNKANYDKTMTMLIVGPNNYMPDWFTKGTFTTSELEVMLKELVYEIMETNNNKAKVDVWGVANELFDNNGVYRNMKWNEMGWENDASGVTGTDKINLKHPVFVGKAFQYARDKTNAILELRDYGIENSDASNPFSHKFRAFYQLIKHLKATNRPVDAVGIQGHIMIGKGMAVGTAENMNANVPYVGYEGFKGAVKKYKDAGLEVLITELDIVNLMQNSQPLAFTPALAEQQQQDYYHVVKAALEAGIKYISLWGVKDNNDPGWRMNQSPLLLDVNYKRKPAYYGIQKALFEAKKQN